MSWIMKDEAGPVPAAVIPAWYDAILLADRGYNEIHALGITIAMTDFEHIRQVAEAWRRDNPNSAGGVCLVWNNEVYGWKDALRDPQNERPGVHAVASDGALWRSEGGNDHDGAERWVPVEEDA